MIFGKLSFSLLWMKHCCSEIYSIEDHTFPGQTQNTNPLETRYQDLMCSPKGCFSHEHIFLLQCPRAVGDQSPVLWPLDVGGSCGSRAWLSGLTLALLHSEGDPVRFPDVSLDLSQFGSGYHHFGIFAVLSCAEAWSTGGACPCPGPMTRKASTSRQEEDMD